MKRYRLMNRINNQFWDGEARSPEEACQQAGWLVSDCWVRELTPVISDSKSESGHRGGGWKNVTQRNI